MTPTPGVTGIVLAGGRSSRFGGPKLDVEIDGRSLLEHALVAVAQVADRVIVAGRSVPDSRLELWPAFPIESVPDREAFGGPLAGLASALAHAPTARAIIVAGDMPGLVPAVLELMLARLAADDALDAVLLASHAPMPAKRQVMPLAIDVARAEVAASDALGAGNRSLVRLLERLRVAEIPAVEWLVLDPTGRTLLDVDRPADVERFRNELR